MRSMKQSHKPTLNERVSENYYASYAKTDSFDSTDVVAKVSDATFKRGYSFSKRLDKIESMMQAVPNEALLSEERKCLYETINLLQSHVDSQNKIRGVKDYSSVKERISALKENIAKADFYRPLDSQAKALENTLDEPSRIAHSQADYQRAPLIIQPTTQRFNAEELFTGVSSNITHVDSPKVPNLDYSSLNPKTSKPRSFLGKLARTAGITSLLVAGVIGVASLLGGCKKPDSVSISQSEYSSLTNEVAQLKSEFSRSSSNYSAHVSSLTESHNLTSSNYQAQISALTESNKLMLEQHKALFEENKVLVNRFTDKKTQEEMRNVALGLETRVQTSQTDQPKASSLDTNAVASVNSPSTNNVSTAIPDPDPIFDLSSSSQNNNVFGKLGKVHSSKYNTGLTNSDPAVKFDQAGNLRARSLFGNKAMKKKSSNSQNVSTNEVTGHIYKVTAVKEGSRNSRENLSNAGHSAEATGASVVAAFTASYGNDVYASTRANDGKFTGKDWVNSFEGFVKSDSPYTGKNVPVKIVKTLSTPVVGLFNFGKETANLITLGMADNVLNPVFGTSVNATETAKHLSESALNTPRYVFKAFPNKLESSVNNAWDWPAVAVPEFVSNVIEGEGYGNSINMDEAVKNKSPEGVFGEFLGAAAITGYMLDNLIDNNGGNNGGGTRTDDPGVGSGGGTRTGGVGVQ